MSAGESRTSHGIPVCFARRVSLSRAEVAETLGMSVSFVDDLLTDGTLHAVKVRQTVFIPASEVWAMLGLAEPVRKADPEARAFLRRLGVG